MTETKQNVASAVLHEHRHKVSASSTQSKKLTTRKERKRETLYAARVVLPHSFARIAKKGKRFERNARESVKNIEELTAQFKDYRLILIVRVKQISGISPYLASILKVMNLTESSCTFLYANKTTFALVAALHELTAFGAPSEATVRNLLNTRGVMRIEGGYSVKIDNLLIEYYLGQFGIVCVEDCVAEIMQCGPHYADVMAMYKYFYLEGYNWERGGEEQCGFLGDRINKFVANLM